MLTRNILQIKFKKYYLRKVAPNEPDVIILQDIKDLVMFLLISPVSIKFINFFHLPIVDRFLRALIIYFQYYIEIWEKLMEERVATLKKAPNPLAGGHRIKYADELHILRCMLSKEYADLILGCQDTVHYHHIISGKKRSSMTQSQGEKDLRIFEALIHISHRVVWIALHRKHFHLIGNLCYIINIIFIPSLLNMIDEKYFYCIYSTKYNFIFFIVFSFAVCMYHTLIDICFSRIRIM